MEKEQILSTLTEKLGQTSFSQRSLSDYVGNNLPADGAEADDAYFEKHVNILKSFNGQFSADVASAINSQMDEKVKEYLKKHPELLNNHKAEPHGTVAQKTGAEGNKDDQRIKVLEEQLSNLIKEREEAKKLSSIQSLVKSVVGKADELKVTRKALWEDAAQKVQYVEGDTTESFLEKVKSQYATDLKRYYGDGEKPYQGEKNPGGGNSGNKTVNDYFARKKAKMAKK